MPPLLYFYKLIEQNSTPWFVGASVLMGGATGWSHRSESFAVAFLVGILAVLVTGLVLMALLTAIPLLVFLSPLLIPWGISYLVMKYYGSKPLLRR